MKKKVMSLFIAMSLLAFNSAAIAGSCDSCSSKSVCSEAKAGASCDGAAVSTPAAEKKTVNAEVKDSQASSLNNVNFAKTDAAKLDYSSISANARAGAKNYVIKLKGDKALLDSLSGEFEAKFGLKDKKGSDCEMVYVASELWIKCASGSEKEKVDYLKSCGIKL